MTSKTAIVAGPDEERLADALESHGFGVTRIEDVVSGETLREAGIDGAALFVLTDLEEATSIAVAKELNPDVRVVAYAHDSLPEFAKAQADLAVDPDLLAADVVAEELAA
ncbi:NAD-binding protein [Halorarum halophilum]|uniref:NAD-binding protein n=1 Tax=Halorarum halophilum TaxID=2743090 RepID=A0A7D5GHM7_9EURY|nr:NAD-binding protein [Halobaculum halophilum]QLG27671.1 NAD-binding protein [Halobaculum halophilum]